MEIIFSEKDSVFLIKDETINNILYREYFVTAFENIIQNKYVNCSYGIKVEYQNGIFQFAMFYKMNINKLLTENKYKIIEKQSCKKILNDICNYFKFCDIKE